MPDFDFEYISRFMVSEWGVKEAEKRILETAREAFPSTEQKVAWLLRAVTFIDLTTLGGNDTNSNVTRLCIKALNPVLRKLLEATEFDPAAITTAAVCVYPARVADAAAVVSVNERKLPVAAVATGFPSGQYSLKTRLAEIEYAISQGATEIDVVIDRSLVIGGRWEELYNELVQMKEACGSAHMKTILAVGELPSLTDIYRASMVAMYAGSDFIKTSTGKETVNATIPFGIVMARAIRDFHAKTGTMVGLKAAGGLRSAQDALNWLVLVHEELGSAWLNKDLFRIGASSLLAAIETELYVLIEGTKPATNAFLPC